MVNGPLKAIWNSSLRKLVVDIGIVYGSTEVSSVGEVIPDREMTPLTNTSENDLSLIHI